MVEKRVWGSNREQTICILAFLNNSRPVKVRMWKNRIMSVEFDNIDTNKTECKIHPDDRAYFDEKPFLFVRLHHNYVPNPRPHKEQWRVPKYK